MTASSKLLTDLMRPILHEWGRAAVLKAVEQLDISHADAPNLLPSGGRPRAASKKLSEIEQVSRLKEPPERLASLMEIAEKYDSRKFLPNLGDVREFLILRGEGRKAITNRSEAFRHLLFAFQEMSFQQLRDLSKSSSFSGPAQLGPLSDAIRASGEALRRGAGDTQAPETSQGDSNHSGKLDPGSEKNIQILPPKS
jgi:hypothetical protein